jgi:RNA polymerase-binding transcription factor DksA
VSAMTEGRDDEHDPDGSTVAFEHSLAAGLLARAEEHLGEMDAALARMSTGTYGRCQRCGEAIPQERLAVRPATPTCVDCASPSGGLDPVRRYARVRRRRGGA